MSEKTVLVTGGTIRLGRAIAARLRADGWRVLTSSHRSDAGADIVADLAEPLGAAKLYAAALRLLGENPPDALVNNAALFTGEEAVLKAVGCEAPKKLTMMMAGRETGVGAVVNVLDAAPDAAGSKASPGYREAKEELRAFTLSSAMMFAASLRVNAVAPGSVLAPEGLHERARETLLSHRPTPEDVAAAVSFLLSAEATTGAILPVDGGDPQRRLVRPLLGPRDHECPAADREGNRHPRSGLPHPVALTAVPSQTRRRNEQEE